ncbi:MAG: Nif3-like dinuclear metal center hexameric protein [Verrucomicrobia bacterium]|nr:MAG: Nif3-like dinuclear metal center hexameric protein [Verrucomicrobiota bacterium]
MPTLSELVSFCDQQTRRYDWKDYPNAYNGLQLENDGSVSRIGAAVDAGRVPFARAAAAGVDFLIVHHGLYWTPPQPLVGAHYRRFATAIRTNLAVYSSHLPLDGHPTLGNNAILAHQLGLTPDATFLQPPESAPVACIAPYVGSRAELLTSLRRQYPRVVAVEHGSARPARIAICSGSGNSAVPELVTQRVDTLVTGELREEWYNYAEENGLNLYCCGHYATEIHGVRALAAAAAHHFNLAWEFIETENPL